MALITLILSSLLVLIPFIKKHEKEEYFLIKLLGLWILCQVYITINNNFRLPLGIICAVPIVYKSKINRNSRFITLITGIISLIGSSLVYLISMN